MALDRYMAIVHPIRSIGWRTVRKTAVVMAATWVINMNFMHCNEFITIAAVVFVAG